MGFNVAGMRQRSIGRAAPGLQEAHVIGNYV